MPARRWILVLLLATAISLLGGCGGSTYNEQNPPPPATQAAYVVVQSTPPSSLANPALINLTQTSTVTATVNNDPSNGGVNWQLVACYADGSNCS